MARVKSIHSLNRFISEDLCPPSECPPNLTLAIYNCGIWLVPSYFNHSCLPNCHRVFFGDTMFLYAIKDLAEGEELFVQYYPGADFLNLYDSRSDILQNGMINL
jgi:hypothetical protein